MKKIAVTEEWIARKLGKDPAKFRIQRDPEFFKSFGRALRGESDIFERPKKTGLAALADLAGDTVEGARFAVNYPGLGGFTTTAPGNRQVAVRWRKKGALPSWFEKRVPDVRESVHHELRHQTSTFVPHSEILASIHGGMRTKGSLPKRLGRAAYRTLAYGLPKDLREAPALTQDFIRDTWKHPVGRKVLTGAAVGGVAASAALPILYLLHRRAKRKAEAERFKAENPEETKKVAGLMDRPYYGRGSDGGSPDDKPLKNKKGKHILYAGLGAAGLAAAATPIALLLARRARRKAEEARKLEEAKTAMTLNEMFMGGFLGELDKTARVGVWPGPRPEPGKAEYTEEEWKAVKPLYEHMARHPEEHEHRKKTFGQVGAVLGGISGAQLGGGLGHALGKSILNEGHPVAHGLITGGGAALGALGLGAGTRALFRHLSKKNREQLLQRGEIHKKLESEGKLPKRIQRGEVDDPTEYPEEFTHAVKKASDDLFLAGFFDGFDKLAYTVTLRPAKTKEGKSEYTKEEWESARPSYEFYQRHPEIHEKMLKRHGRSGAAVGGSLGAALGAGAGGALAQLGKKPTLLKTLLASGAGGLVGGLAGGFGGRALGRHGEKKSHGRVLKALEHHKKMEAEGRLPERIEGGTMTGSRFGRVFGEGEV